MINTRTQTVTIKAKATHIKTTYFLNEPYLKGNEKKYLNDVIDSNWLSIKGKHTQIFEKDFSKFIGVDYSLAVQSGTAALHTALLALGISEGDTVVVPNFTCGGCVTSVIQCGAEPIILDVENETFGLDAKALEKLIRRNKPTAVMLVHVYGIPARDLDKIISLCKKNGIFLLEDCCEAHGAEHNQQKLGSFGDISVFSLRSEKMIGAGEGGIISTNNKYLIDKATYWASRAALYRGKEDPYWYKYYYSGVGMNYLMPHLIGAVARAQLENFDEILYRKRQVGKKYHELLQNAVGIRLQKVQESANPVYWLNIVLLEDKTKEEVREIGNSLIASGVEIRPAFWPLGDQLPFKNFTRGKQKNGDYLFEHGIILPSSVYLADNNCLGVKEICKLLLHLVNQS